MESYIFDVFTYILVCTVEKSEAEDHPSSFQEVESHRCGKRIVTWTFCEIIAMNDFSHNSLSYTDLSGNCTLVQGHFRQDFWGLGEGDGWVK